MRSSCTGRTANKIASLDHCLCLSCPIPYDTMPFLKHRHSSQQPDITVYPAFHLYIAQTLPSNATAFEGLDTLRHKSVSHTLVPKTAPSFSSKTSMPGCNAAPEVLANVRQEEAYQGRPIDVWSSGVVLYAMLFFRYPFDERPGDAPHQRQQLFIDRIQAGDVQ